MQLISKYSKADSYSLKFTTNALGKDKKGYTIVTRFEKILTAKRHQIKQHYKKPKFGLVKAVNTAVDHGFEMYITIK